MLGMRLNEYRNSFAMPKGVTCPNIEAKGSDSMNGGNQNLEYGNIHPSFRLEVLPPLLDVMLNQIKRIILNGPT